MKFGSVDQPETIDFSLPGDHPGTRDILERTGASGPPAAYVGCAKWNRQELKGFYPAGTEDELTYYATQFNAVELNATFYRIFSAKQISEWKQKVPEGFRFFPKVNRQISHLKWLGDIDEAREYYLNSIAHFEEKLGTVFLQLRDNFTPKFFDRVEDFLESWPAGIPLAVEFRHPEWFADAETAPALYELLEKRGMANVITDTAGRRDLLHMRLTSDEAFVRFVGANHPTDYSRLDDWIERLENWVGQGLGRIHFFIHQNMEKESPLLAAYFIEKLNETVGTDLKIPAAGSREQGELF